MVKSLLEDALVVYFNFFSQSSKQVRKITPYFVTSGKNNKSVTCLTHPSQDEWVKYSEDRKTDRAVSCVFL